MRRYPIVEQENLASFFGVSGFIRLEQSRSTEVGEKKPEAY